MCTRPTVSRGRSGNRGEHFGGRRAGATATGPPTVWGPQRPNGRFCRHLLKCQKPRSSTAGSRIQKSLRCKHLPDCSWRTILGEGEEVDNFSTHSG